MLKIRLQRIGRRNDPSFRVVVVDSHRGPKSGKAVETIGAYNPKTKVRRIDADRVRYWKEHGALVSDTVHNMLVGEKIIDAPKINALPRKAPIVSEQDAAAEATPTASPEGEVSAAEAPETGEINETPAEEKKPEAPAEPAVQTAGAEPEEKKEEASPGASS